MALDVLISRSLRCNHFLTHAYLSAPPTQTLKYMLLQMRDAIGLLLPFGSCGFVPHILYSVCIKQVHQSRVQCE